LTPTLFIIHREAKINSIFNLIYRSQLSIFPRLHISYRKNKDVRKPFSVADVKTMYHNELVLKRFFIKFGINPNLSKNKTKALELLNYGKIAA
jgi:hypothetical protein